MDSSEQDIIEPLIDNNNSSLPQHSNPTSSSNVYVIRFLNLSIPINMSFIFSSLMALGALLFSGTVWYIVASVEPFYFIGHPTFMSLVVLMSTLGTLFLQKAGTRQEKDVYLNYHKLLQSIAFLSVIGGFYFIYTFKMRENKDHFVSPHGKAGLLTFSLILIQTIAGSTLVNFPGLVGGVAKARKMYKYHRTSGYVVLFLIYLTALGGSQADWTKAQFDHIWVWLLAAGMVLVGTIGGAKTNKLKVR